MSLPKLKEEGITRPSAIRSTLKKIEEGHYYDASQMAMTLVNRCISRGMDSEAVKLCRLFAAEMIKTRQFDLAANLGVQMVKVFNEFELPVTEERVRMVLDIYTPTPDKPLDERNRLIERAVKWSSNNLEQTSDIPPCVIQLHEAAGQGYQEFGLYGQAQNHLVFCGDGNKLAMLVKVWSRNGYPSERELFVLRLVLILLAKGDLNVAKAFIESPGRKRYMTAVNTD